MHEKSSHIKRCLPITVAFVTFCALHVGLADDVLAVDGTTKLVAASGARDAGATLRHSSGRATETTTNSIGMKLVRIPAGEFMMGADEDRAATLNQFPYADPKWLAGETPRHRVHITKPYNMGQFEVTLGQFLAFYHASGYKTDAERDGKPSWGYQNGRLVESNTLRPWAPGWDIGNDHPAVCVSWNDAVAFCNWLSKKEGKTYRLPTEAEWEYACRGRMDTRYSFGDEPEDLTYQANGSDQDRKTISPKAVLTSMDENGNKINVNTPFPYLTQRDGYAWTSPVGKFLPNLFGLYDMHGNAWEWCSDWHDAHYYEKSSGNDPQGPATGASRVLRGGGFNYAPALLRCASRQSDAPASRSCSYGFRVVCEQ